MAETLVQQRANFIGFVFFLFLFCFRESTVLVELGSVLLFWEISI